MDNYGRSIVARHFEVFADYFQVWLEDEQAPLIPKDFWTAEALERHVALAPGVVEFGTARNFTVPLDVVVSGAAPELNLDQWDRVVEVSLDVPTGILVVMGCTEYVPKAERMRIQSGTYRVRVCAAGLDRVSPNRLEGEDQYRAELWPAPMAEPAVIKL